MSQIRGYNNDSGMINTRMNGMTQYRSPVLLFNGINSREQKFYVNPENVDKLLETMNHEEPKNSKSEFDIPDIPNRDLGDGGFENRYDVRPQTEPRRLNLPSEFKKLAFGDIGNMPLKENKQNDPFKRFISKLK